MGTILKTNELRYSSLENNYIIILLAIVALVSLVFANPAKIVFLSGKPRHG